MKAVEHVPPSPARPLRETGTNTFGVAEVAVVLRDLVLEDQVVAPRVPRELADEPVILVEVVAGVREDQLRVDRAFSSSNTSLTSAPM